MLESQSAELFKNTFKKKKVNAFLKRGTLNVI